MQYIPSTIPNHTLRKIQPLGGRPTKVALRRVLADQPGRLEFVSASAHHQDGRPFTLDEAVTAYGPVGIEVRYLGNLFAVIEYDGTKAVVR